MTTINSNPTLSHLETRELDRSSADRRVSTTADAGGTVRKAPYEVGPDESEESSPGSAQPSPEPEPDEGSREDERPS